MQMSSPRKMKKKKINPKISNTAASSPRVKLLNTSLSPPEHPPFNDPRLARSQPRGTALELRGPLEKALGSYAVVNGSRVAARHEHGTRHTHAQPDEWLGRWVLRVHREEHPEERPPANDKQEHDGVAFAGVRCGRLCAPRPVIKQRLAAISPLSYS